MFLFGHRVFKRGHIHFGSSFLVGKADNGLTHGVLELYLVAAVECFTVLKEKVY